MRFPEDDLCPTCGQHQVVEVVYGFPGPEMIEDFEAGRIVLGGCLVFDDEDGNILDTQRVCRNCGWHQE